MSIAQNRTSAFLNNAEPLSSATGAGLSVLSEGDVLRWRYGERLENVVEDTCRRNHQLVAVSSKGRDITYGDLNARANRMARLLLERGVQPGDRVAILLDRGLDCYVALLGLLKAKAAYVPIDANHPADRLAYIVEDSQVRMAVVHRRFADRFPADLPVMAMEEVREELDAQSDSSLLCDERNGAAEATCYILYTSGTTGRPKGVAVAHPSICNFVRVAAESYGYRPGDRVYQGMSIAFDFSVEELWVPLVAGATLVPNESATSLFGEELADFLETSRVTCLCCVPTLLASIERDLSGLRLLLIGGEACPPALVKRWSRQGRELLNSYGPTEATVTATLGRMRPDKPVTIGRPLPTYSIVILDPERAEALALGEAGEIGIAGIGVAEGYLNRPELTRVKFIPDFLKIPNNPSGRIYRTGDLARITADGEIEYLGRIDTQVKLRGYRIELTEIESVLLERPEVAQAAVATFEPTPGAPELVAYYSIKHGIPAPSPVDLLTHLRSRLPAYMAPAYLERLPFVPTLVSNKTDRAQLPKPKSQPVRHAGAHAEPETALERTLCETLKAALSLEKVSIDGDFFKDYNAHSLLMARFCARMRMAAPLAPVAMRDIYAHTTIRRLATALQAARPSVASYAETSYETPNRLAYALTGAAQLAFYVLTCLAGVAAAQASFTFTLAAASPLSLLTRAQVVTMVWFFGLNALAIAAKWLLLGRVRPGTIKLWSIDYYRFWAVRRLMSLAPALLFPGEPLFNAFLRCLGARIGARAVIYAGGVPVAADLFEVGEDAVISRRVMAPGYGVDRDGLHFGAVQIGRCGFVGEGSLLDYDTAIGNFGQLGHASSLQRGQRVPDGKRFHGSPAEETETNFRMTDELKTEAWRRALFAFGQLALLLLVIVPLADAGMTLLLGMRDANGAATPADRLAAAIALAPKIFAISLATLMGALLTGLLSVFTIPRLCHFFLREGRHYRLFGWAHFLQTTTSRIANAAFFHLLLGDSVLIERFLKLSGVRLSATRATGSNFGTEQAFENPFLCEIGAGTVASDGLTMGNVQLSSHSFRLGVARVGANSFLGTDVFIPPGARLGDNCLLGTKVMTPIDGRLRENVGLLGSPAFEIPRAAARDVELAGRLDDAERQRRLRHKLRHNIGSMLLLLGKTLAMEFLALYVFALTAGLYGWNNLPAMAAAVLSIGMAFLSLDVLTERWAFGFRRMKPIVATSYDRAFWEVERYWKLSSAGPRLDVFAGTPFRPMLLRLMGAKIGRCVFDDGLTTSERTLVEIGDGAIFNQFTMLQSHSLEEGAYKSDFVRIGAGSTLGTGAFVHYGVTLGERTRLDPDVFLMKGEITPPDSRWRGNPAQLVGRRALPLAAE